MCPPPAAWLRVVRDEQGFPHLCQTSGAGVLPGLATSPFLWGASGFCRGAASGFFKVPVPSLEYFEEPSDRPLLPPSPRVLTAAVLLWGRYPRGQSAKGSERGRCPLLISLPVEAEPLFSPSQKYCARLREYRKAERRRKITRAPGREEDCGQLASGALLYLFF